MSSESVRDIIDRVRGVHAQLSIFYGSRADASDKERVRMLLNYLSRHEDRLDAALSAFEQGASRGVLGTWFKGEPDVALKTALDGLKITPSSDTDEVIRMVLAVDRALVDAFRRVLDAAHAEDVKALFQTLIGMEERQEQRLIRDAIELEDV